MPSLVERAGTETNKLQRRPHTGSFSFPLGFSPFVHSFPSGVHSFACFFTIFLTLYFASFCFTFSTCSKLTFCHEYIFFLNYLLPHDLFTLHFFLYIYLTKCTCALRYYISFAVASLCCMCGLVRRSCFFLLFFSLSLSIYLSTFHSPTRLLDFCCYYFLLVFSDARVGFSFAFLFIADGC